jgi:hypothetical protein
MRYRASSSCMCRGSLMVEPFKPRKGAGVGTRGLGDDPPLQCVRSVVWQLLYSFMLYIAYSHSYTSEVPSCSFIRSRYHSRTPLALGLRPRDFDVCTEIIKCAIWLLVDFDSRRRCLFADLWYLAELIDVETLELLEIGSHDTHTHNVLRCVSARQQKGRVAVKMHSRTCVDLPCRSPRE